MPNAVAKARLTQSDPEKMTPKASAAFELYKGMPPRERSLTVLATLTGHHHSQLGHWSSLYRWQDKVARWDKQQAEKERKRKKDQEDQQIEREQAEIRAMNDRHIQIARAEQLVAIEAIRRLHERGKNNEKGGLGAIASIQLLQLSTQLERLARGEPPQKVEVTGKDGGPIEIAAVRDRILGKLAGYAARRPALPSPGGDDGLGTGET